MNPSGQAAMSVSTTITYNNCQRIDYIKVIRLYCETLGPRQPVYSCRVVPRTGYTCVLTLPANIISHVLSSIQKKKGLAMLDAARLACELLREKRELGDSYEVLKPKFQAPVFPAFGNIKISETEQQQLGFGAIDIEVLRTALTPRTDSATSPSWEIVGEAFMKFFFASYFFARHQDDLEGALTKRIDNEVCKTVMSKHIQSSALNLHVCAGNAGLKKTENLSVSVFRRVIGAFVIHGGLDAALEAAWMLGAAVDGSTANMRGIQVVYQINRPADLTKFISCSKDALELDQDMAARVDDVQKALGYTFNDVGILVEALTHESISVKNPEKRSYDRLELLGDGVLEHIVVEHYYRQYPTTSSKDFKIFAKFVLCNNSLGSFYASLGLQTTLMTDPEEFVNNWIEDAESVVRDRARGVMDMEKLHLNKVLGDAMEALVGAIFVDGGMDLEPVRRIVTRSYMPFIDGSGVACHIGKGVTTNPVGKRSQAEDAEDDQLLPAKKAKA
ncbi:Dicer-like protein 1 [Entomortierella lignicola]|nr:Dicer-like protein 1 [Entomortierella lignicola]